MDTQSAFNKLVENLSFQVLKGPCKKDIARDISKNTSGTPINVKIKLRHKDDNRNKDVFSMAKPENSNTSNKLRLVNSDQTITSFNLLMRTDKNKETMKKSQNKVLQLFKPGACLKTQKDDDNIYSPETTENSIQPLSARKKDDIQEKENFAIKKNFDTNEPLNDPIRQPKIFLGKCKPGGCLDPPFGEDKYAYEPANITRTKGVEKYPTQESKDLNQSSLSNIRIYPGSPPKCSNLETKIITDSLITYPSNLLDIKHSSRKDSIEKSMKCKKETVPLNTNTYLESYYTPPKSKDTSLSSASEETVDINTGVKNRKVASLSEDSIMPVIGGPVTPILPVTIKLSPVKSNTSKLQYEIKSITRENNVDYSPCDVKKLSISKVKVENNANNRDNDYNKQSTPDKLSYLENLSVNSEQKSIQLPIPFTLPKDETQSKKETSLKQDSEDLESKDIIVIAPFKKSIETSDNHEKENYIADLHNNKDPQLIVDNTYDHIDIPNKPMQQNQVIGTKNIYNEDILSSSPIVKSISSINADIIEEYVEDKNVIHNLDLYVEPNSTINENKVTNRSNVVDSHVINPESTSEQIPQYDNINIDQIISETGMKSQFIFGSQKDLEIYQKKSSSIHNEPLPNNNSRITSKNGQESSDNNIKITIFNEKQDNYSFDNDSITPKAILNTAYSVQDPSLTSKLHYEESPKLILGNTSEDKIHSTHEMLNIESKPSAVKYQSVYVEGKKIYDDTEIDLNKYEKTVSGNGNISVLATGDVSLNDKSNHLNETYETLITPLKKESTDRTQVIVDQSKYSAIFKEPDKIKDDEENTLTVHGKIVDSIESTGITSYRNKSDKPNETRTKSDKEKQKKKQNTFEDKTKGDLPYKEATKINHDINAKNIPRNLKNSKISEDNSIDLDFAFGIIEADNKRRIIKTFDSNIMPKNMENTQILIKSTINTVDDKIAISVDSRTDIVLQMKTNMGKEKMVKDSALTSNGLPESENAKLNASHSKINISHVLLQETINSIYEHNLVPVENMLKGLKEDVDILVQSQKVIQQMLKAGKNKATKHVIANRRCGCYRK